MRLQRPSRAMAVALLALFVALGGTGYAVANLPANSVGTKQLKKKAVTGKKIRGNAVTSPKVKDFSLLAEDFKAGELPAGAKGDRGDQGPPGPTFGATAMGSPLEPATDPAANPDESSSGTTNVGRHFDFTLPTAGRLYARFFISLWGGDCSAGGARAGLYLDGIPVPGSGRALAPSTIPSPTELVAVVAASAGAHALEVRQDCPGGSPTNGASNADPTWTVVLLGS
jgi:hypothetical protein